MTIKLELTIGDKKQKAEGKTIKEAVDKFKKPATIVAGGNLRIYKNNKFVYQFPMTVIRLRRLFADKFSFKDIFIKNIEVFIK